MSAWLTCFLSIGQVAMIIAVFILSALVGVMFDSGESLSVTLGASAEETSSGPSTYSGCQHVIVGAGWSGTYFAWRMSVDSGHIWDANATCVFEALGRVGGRAYSKVAAMPGSTMDDVRIDLGAYRFDSHAFPLLNRVFKDELKMRTKCYDPAACDKIAGKLMVAEDEYGNNGGYASGPEGLLKLFTAAGGRLFLEHRLDRIDRNTTSNLPVLTFQSEGQQTLIISAETVFLNMPKSAILALHPESVLFEDEKVKEMLQLPKEEPGAKLFLHYRVMPWRIIPQLQQGDFEDHNGQPPLKGRFHDSYTKCPPSAAPGVDCEGAVLVYYDFDNEEVEYFSQFQASRSEPYTYIPLNDATSQGKREMLSAAHDKFVGILRKRMEDLHLTKSSGFDVDSLTIDKLAGGILAIWRAGGDADSALIPGPSFLVEDDFTIRNRISKPVLDLPIYLGNEAYSGGNGWAHPAIVMTERIIWMHFQKKPSWVTECPSDCLYARDGVDKCTDCVSETFWQQNINSSLTTDNYSKFVRLQRPAYCPQEYASARNELAVSWQWVKSDKIVELHLRYATVDSPTWIGFGIGRDMNDAIMFVAFFNGTVQTRTSNAHVVPKQTSVPAALKRTVEFDDANGIASWRMTLQFDVFNVTSAITHTQLDAGRVPFLFAASHTPLLDGEMQQHTFEIRDSLNIACGRKHVPNFQDDIRPLFRMKDRQAMLFAFDLYSCAQVQDNAHDILNRLEDRTVRKLATGMPIDIEWTLGQIHVFRAWNEQMPPENCTASEASDCSTNPITFSKDILPLFRDVDRSAMIKSFDLFVCADVQAKADAIIEHLDSDMPCAMHGGLWSPEKRQTFKNWMKCGKPCGDGTAVPTDREVFYKTLNIASFPEFVPQAWEAMQHYLKLAENQQKSSTAPWYSAPLTNYTVEAFEAVLDRIYDEIAADGDSYDPAADPQYRTKAAVVERVRQMAPFNLIDGAWLSRCCPTGPMDELYSMLWGILNDEMGGGDSSLNHCQLYQDLLHSLGIFLPSVSSREFAYDETLVDAAFTEPAYAVTLSYFSDRLFPELLGTTLQIEWTVPGLVPSSKRHKYWGISSLFFDMHIGIDNAVAGHGYRAKRAVMLYLDQVRADGGQEAVQEAYERIWKGFVAFDGIGDLDKQLTDKIDQIQELPAKRVMDMMARKAKYGSKNHRKQRVGTHLINAQFSNVERFVKDLSRSAWVVPGHPEYSPLLTRLTTFHGPMYKVFTDDDMEIWRIWIASIAPPNPKLLPQGGRVLDLYDVATAAAYAIQRLWRVATAVTAHNSVRIWGPSQLDANVLVEQSVAQWLEIAAVGNSAAILSALMQPRNRLVVCGHPANSSYLQMSLQPSTEMGQMFAEVAMVEPGFTDDQHPSSVWTYRDIIERWIAAGCPLPDATTVHTHDKPRFSFTMMAAADKLVSDRATPIRRERYTH